MARTAGFGSGATPGQLDRKLYRPMKMLRLTAAFLVAALLLCCPGKSGLQHPGGSRVVHDFGSFREARMQLPEKEEVLCPVEMESINLSNNEQLVFPELKHLPEYRLVQNCSFDLDGDSVEEEYTLRDGKLTVRTGSCVIWESLSDWWVDYCFFGDADNDGSPELNLLVWREESFGPHKPFWLEEDNPGVKNHLFVFKLDKGNIKPVWQSSSLDCPNYWAALIDLTGDGENELVALEGCYTDPGKRKITLWKWNGWGFSRIDAEEN